MGARGTVWPTVTWEGEVKCKQLLHGSETYSANQLLHGCERYSATNCYREGRGEVRPTVSWEREVQCDQLFHGSERYSVTNCFMAGRKVKCD